VLLCQCRIECLSLLISFFTYDAGEFLGYFGGANILMEYVFSNAAVARSFTEYLSFAFGENNPNVWRVEVHGLPKDYNMLDFPAVALILLLTLCLCHRFVSFIASVSLILFLLFFSLILYQGLNRAYYAANFFISMQNAKKCD